MRTSRVLNRFARDERGVVILIFALGFTVILGFMALGIDVGTLYYRQKALQTQADLAAVSAASNLAGDPEQRALDTLDGNGLAAPALHSIDYGRFVRDPALRPDQRLLPRTLADQDVNAARVRLAVDAPLYFARSFLDAESTVITAEATAARYSSASFSLNSRLASVELLDALLQAALGTSVSVDLLDGRQGLLDTQVDLLTFMDALATRLDIAAGNYEDLLLADAGLPDIAGALLDIGAVDGATDLLSELVSGAGGAVLGTSQLIAIQGGDVAAQVEDILPRITVSALDILVASLDIINASRHIELDLPITLTGLLDADIALVVGERPPGSGWITVGERGATLHTAQTRLKLSLDLAPSLLAGVNGGQDLAAVRLPVYLEIASATARLTALHCSASDPADVIARFDVGTDALDSDTGTHVAELFLGEFTAPGFEDFNTPLRQQALQPAEFLSVRINPLGLSVLELPLVIDAYAPVGLSEAETLDFTLAELPAEGEVTTKTFGSGRILTAVLDALADDANVQVGDTSLLGISLDGLLAPIVNTVLFVIQDVVLDILIQLIAPPDPAPGQFSLDALLDSLLETLGIGIGEADLSLHGVSCGNVLLVR